MPAVSRRKPTGSHRGTAIDVMQLELAAIEKKSSTRSHSRRSQAQAIERFAKEYLPLAPAVSRDEAGR